MFGATSGKAYPWALPPWDNRIDVGYVILDELLAKLRDRLLPILPSAFKHHDSDSDSGRSDGGKVSRVEKHMRGPPANFHVPQV